MRSKIQDPKEIAKYLGAVAKADIVGKVVFEA